MKWAKCVRWLFLYLQNRRIKSITKGDGRDFLRSLKSHKYRGKLLSSATVGKYFNFTRGFLNQAVEAEILDKNPFSGIVAPRKSNRKRQRFIKRQIIQTVIDAAPDAEMRLVITLSRFGGVRVPSEVNTLRWEDIDWENSRIKVHSPKTEHHEGHESRWVPLFPELLPYLLDSRELASADNEYVVVRRSQLTDSAFRREMYRIINKAKLEQWPRVFHNLRSSRQTELEDRFPSHVVNAWMGNSEKVAKEHYLQVTEEHFARAVVGLVPGVVESGGKIGGATQRKASQTEEKQEPPNADKVRLATRIQAIAAIRDALRNELTGVDGNRTHLATSQRPQRI